MDKKAEKYEQDKPTLNARMCGDEKKWLDKNNYVLLGQREANDYDIPKRGIRLACSNIMAAVTALDSQTASGSYKPSQRKMETIRVF